ncbi:MAG: ABC transporter ATP-binding protein [Candidatus Tectomicrobia bacterium]|nr:ABC transporter ATP-binding protein [Candidatus Tectomicrobia bacterium]
MTPQSPLLELDRIAIAFGGIQALAGVSFTMTPGEILGLIGPNGSGKTTLLNVLGNLYRADMGTIHFLGRRIDRLPIHHIALQGLARTFQVARVFRRMSVLDNMLVPGHTANEEEAASPQQLRQRARELLDFLEIAHLSHEQAGNLSGGQQKLLEFARALMLKPRLVLLDEPFAGVHPMLKERMLQRIGELHEQGIDFIIVSHDLPTILGVSSRLVVLANGEKIADGAPDVVRHQDEVVEAYLGI